MLARVFTVTLNTYREAVRARILHGLFGLAVVTLGYALVVGAYALRSHDRVVSDLGSAAISAYSIVVAVVITATSLYRELELKTIYPILARPMRRSEYIIGKFLGTWLTLLVFIVANAGVLLVAIGIQAGAAGRALWPLLLLATAVSTIAYKKPKLRTWLPIPCAALVLALGVWLSSAQRAEMRVIVLQGALTALEVGVVAALTLVFAAFSSPFLTAVFSLAMVVVGRGAATLAALPERVFGAFIKSLGEGLAALVPNLMVYVPTRAFLTGEAVAVPLWPYMGWASLQALGWIVFLLAGAALIFERRDFL